MAPSASVVRPLVQDLQASFPRADLYVPRGQGSHCIVLVFKVLPIKHTEKQVKALKDRITSNKGHPFELWTLLCAARKSVSAKPTARIDRDGNGEFKQCTRWGPPERSIQPVLTRCNPYCDGRACVETSNFLPCLTPT